MLANLLRSHVPTLIAMTGRPVATAGVTRDRIGSRWLAASPSHLAARYLASTAPQHLERVKVELRRHDGIARLDRMDIVPDFADDGSPVVIVRCIDAAPSLATARAHALVLAALALRARRLVRDGKRVGNVPQRTLEENRARAIADGLRARFVLDEAPGRNRHGEGRAGHGEAREPRMVGARDAIRWLLQDLCAEFSNLEAAAEELAPVILPVELPQLGLRRVASDGELLAGGPRMGTRCSRGPPGTRSPTPRWAGSCSVPRFRRAPVGSPWSWSDGGRGSRILSRRRGAAHSGEAASGAGKTSAGSGRVVAGQIAKGEGAHDHASRTGHRVDP